MSMINEITSQAPRYKRGLRKGRGESSGHGKTSGRGTKGAGARGGDVWWKPGHEGGQTPLHRRLPARGFSNDRFERDWYIVNIGDLERFADGATVDVSSLIQAKLISDTKLPVKILGTGTLTKKLTILAGWYSHTAFDRIAALGGVAHNAKGEPFVFPKPKKKFVPQDKAKKSEGGKKVEVTADAAAPAKPAEAPPAQA